MGRKVTVSLEITYDFKGELLRDYCQWKDDYPDTKSARKWFVIDRFIGHDNLDKLLSENIIDRKAKVVVKEKK
jgi:hypothetical protein